MARMAILVMVALALLAVQAGPARGASWKLSPAEWQRVLAGEPIVHKREQQARGLRLIGGAAFLRVDAPAEAVWAVAVRPQLYRHVLPYAVEARDIQGGVFVRHAFPGGEASYRLRISRDDARRVLSFTVVPDRSGSVRGGFGELRVKRLDDARAVIAWTVMAAPELGLLGELFRGAVQDAMLEVPARIASFLERTRLPRDTARPALLQDLDRTLVRPAPAALDRALRVGWLRP